MAESAALLVDEVLPETPSPGGYRASVSPVRHRRSTGRFSRKDSLTQSRKKIKKVNATENKENLIIPSPTLSE